MNPIKQKLNDAIFLWENGRKESAFLLVLVSVAAISKMRYSKNTGDKNAFISTIKSFRTVSLSIEFQNQLLPIEVIFYEWIRCYLIHEAKLPPKIEFMEETEENCMSVRAGGAPEYVLKIGNGWFFHFVNSVMNSKELKEVV